MNRLNILLFLSIAVALVPASGDSLFLYSELNGIVGYCDDIGWIGEKGKALKNSVGFEFFQKYSGEFGDFLTANLQARISYDTSHGSNEDWALEIHNAWVEYKLGLGKDLRAGHFSPAFGLEPSMDTHGTLFQTLAGTDIGYKKDWGIGYRGAAGIFDYEVAGQLGTGMGIERRDNSYLASGRIGPPPGGDVQYGVSLLYGEVLPGDDFRIIPRPRASGEMVQKQRIGADARWLLGPFLFMWEGSFGKNDSDDVLGTLIEADYTVPAVQSLTLKGQGRYWSDDPGNPDRVSLSVGLGLSYRANDAVTLRSAVFHDVEKSADGEDTRIFIQFYYFGKVL